MELAAGLSRRLAVDVDAVHTLSGCCTRLFLLSKASSKLVLTVVNFGAPDGDFRAVALEAVDVVDAGTPSRPAVDADPLAFFSVSS